MPFLPPPETDSPDQNTGRPNLPSQDLGGLSAEELAQSLAARGQKLKDQNNAIQELNRRRRRNEQ